MRAFALFALGALASVVSGTPIKKRASPPSQDTFYNPPADFATAAPGTVLKTRSVSVGEFGIIPLLDTAYQLLYRTSSANGTAIATVTTIFIPGGANYSQLVAFATAEDSSWSNCAPSYNYQFLGGETDFIVDFEVSILTGFLNLGYIVTSSDHEGPDSAFASGRLEGHAVLDSIRATLAFTTLKFAADTKVAIAGYSGGAVGAGWAAALQPTYAPEINLVGAAHGGTPSDVAGTVKYLDGGLFAGFAFAGVAGLANSYSSLNNLVIEITTATGKTAINYANDHCAFDDVFNFLGDKIESLTYQSDGSNLLSDPVVEAVTSTLILGSNKTETPTAPLLIYHSNTDEVIPVADIETTVTNYCANGASVDFILTQGGGHISEELGLASTVYTWVQDRFAGIAQTGCKTTSSAFAIPDENSLGASMQPILSKLNNVLLTQVGLNDEIYHANIQTASAEYKVNGTVSAATLKPLLANGTSTSA